MTLVLFMLFAGGAGVLGFSFLALSRSSLSREILSSEKSYFLSEAGLEDVMHRVKSNKPYSSPETLTLDGDTAVTTVTSMGITREIVTTATLNKNVRKVEAKYVIATQNVDFFYGVQVGEGGVEMGQNSQIIGSIYSNGNVEGESGARVTGDLWVGGGANPALDANWTIQNADFSFGNTVGAILSTVDSTGSVGQYTSLALGSDGYGRISYMDNTNKDLKYARCTNTDCSTSVRTAVDTVGEVYEVTSLTLEASDLAHISYYHDGNDDQKYARCTNADCTTKNLTLIETAGNVGDTSSIKLGSDGFARISYFQDDNGDLKFARCTNADCTTKNVVIIDAVGYLAEYHSLALGSDGFARISYDDATNGDLKFVRCLDADCSTKNITVVDSAGNVGTYNSLVLGSDGFARISYYDATNGDLKFVRCLDADCTTKNIVTVDSSGIVGQYTSIALGSDGFARISYYDSSNGDLKFARCTNADCTTKTLTTVDTGSSVGKHTSLVLGSDEFGRISYFAEGSADLKFARCVDDPCTGPTQRADVGQSFRLATSTNAKLRRVSLYLKKVGSPPDIPIRIMPDEGGRPDNSSGNTITSGTLSAASVTGTYGWIDVSFTTNPTLNTGTTYWIMADTTIDNNNYWVWGEDNTDAYAGGTAKHTPDWTTGGTWTNVNGDLDFRVWVGGSDTSITGVTVNGDAHAHSITTSNVCGDAYYQSIDASSLNFLNTPTTPTCPTPLSNGTAHPGSADPSLLSMPISQSNIDQWKTDAAAGGTITGNYTVSNDVSLGPKKITGNLVVTANNKTLTVTGTLWVQGTIDISNGSAIRCDASYGINSCVVISDGWIHVANNGTFSGSGDPASFIMLLSTLACTGVPGVGCGHHDGAIDVHNQATAVIFYAQNGMVNLHNGVNVTEVTAYKLNIDNTATVTYNQGLVNAQFLSGPSSGWSISSWKEVE